jgi:hypothetical protein
MRLVALARIASENREGILSELNSQSQEYLFVQWWLKDQLGEDQLTISKQNKAKFRAIRDFAAS